MRVGLSPAMSVALRIATDADTIHVGNGKPDLIVQPGDTVVCNYKDAHLDVGL